MNCIEDGVKFGEVGMRRGREGPQFTVICNSTLSAYKVETLQDFIFCADNKVLKVNLRHLNLQKVKVAWLRYQ
jgi:hypothetical protein